MPGIVVRYDRQINRIEPSHDICLNHLIATVEPICAPLPTFTPNTGEVGLIIRDRDGDVTGADASSVNCKTMSVNVPTTKGVPLIVHPVRLIPVGHAPDCSEQV